VSEPTNGHPTNGHPDPRALPGGEPAGPLATGPRPAPLAAPDPNLLWATTQPLKEEAHFWDYWRVVVRHRWTVISFLVTSLVVATVWTWTTRPIFSATATLRIEKEEPRVLKFEEVVKADSEPDYYQTQFKLLQSRTLASRVIGLLALDRHPEFAGGKEEPSWFGAAEAWAREQLIRWVPVPPPPAPEASEDLTVESGLTRSFLGRLSVDPVRNARLVRVSFVSHYPDLAARVVNTLAEAFIAQSLDQKVETTRYATQFLSKQMEDARQKLEAAETKLSRFLEGNDIVFVSPDKSLGERVDLATQQLSFLSDALLKARSERITRESAVHQAVTRDVESLPTVLENSLVTKLKDELVTLEGEYRKLGQTFKTEYPRMQRLSQQIAEIRTALKQEIARVVEAMDSAYRAALRNEQALEKAMSEHRTVVKQLGDKMAQYNLLRRDVETSRELYTSLLTRLKETQISAALVTSAISIVDRAEVPTTPSSPSKRRNLMLAALIGLVGGVGLAFFIEYLDTSIKDPKEIESVLHVPAIGVVPSRSAMAGRRGWSAGRLPSGEQNGDVFALVANSHSGSALAEAFRNLRTSLLYSAPDHPPRTLMVTSLYPEDGKTSLATNLAITLSQLGSGEILLVDGDLRRSNLHEILKVRLTPGLSTFLTGQTELAAVIKPTQIHNLYTIPAGRTPLNPAELMASRRLQDALGVLGERFAHIIFDAPPLIGVSDALILAPRLDGVVLVLRQGQASRDAAQRGVHLLRSVRARVLGVILNDVNPRTASTGYYGYYGYYGYGYGYGGRPRAPEA
jgi:capsular exopolysaccharide synthesis family protein